jgi:hypothetical protein
MPKHQMMCVCLLCQHGSDASPTIRLPCKHVFHTRCVKYWTDKIIESCPLCQTTIPESTLNVIEASMVPLPVADELDEKKSLS